MNFTLNDIFAVIDKVKETGLESFEYKDADTKLRIGGGTKCRGALEGRTSGTGPGGTGGREFSAIDKEEAADRKAFGIFEAGPAETETGNSGLTDPEKESCPQGKLLKSPMVGTFYTAPSEEAEPFIRPGDRVKAGQTVGIVEAMKLMNEITAEWDGVVEEILVKNGDIVEYGQPLLRVC